MGGMDKKTVDALTVREINADDTEKIALFFDRMGPESRSVFNRRDYNRKGVLKFIAKPDGTRRYYAAELDGELAAYFFFLDYNTSIPELGIAVRDDLAGRGIGSYLVSLAVEMAKNEGKGGIQLTTHVANLRAQTLYESQGFVCKGVCKNGTELFYLLNFR